MKQKLSWLALLAIAFSAALMAWLAPIAQGSPLPLVIRWVSPPPIGNASLLSTWSKTFGGSLSDEFNSIIPTSDGGHIAIGYTKSFSASQDLWGVKLDASGNVTWQKTYGGSNIEAGSSVAQTSDGGYIVAGRTKSFGAGDSDIWLLKLDGSGNITWQQTYGGSGADTNPRVTPTSDGGYIFGAKTTSSGAGGSDIWVIKLNGSGDITWQKTYGGTLDEFIGRIIQSNEGGYLLTATTNSFGAGTDDVWVIKLDTLGNVTWQKTYGGTGSERVGRALVQTADGGYIVGGSSSSFGAGLNDAWVLKLDSSGNVTWQKTYGGAGDDFVDFIMPTTDGGYIFSADTTSFGPNNKAWVVKLDSSGNVTWQKIYGGANLDSPNSVFPTSDGGYIVGGSTQSFGAGNDDGWVFKVDANGNLADICPSPSSTFATIMNSSATVGTTAITPATTLAMSSTTSVTLANTSFTPGNTSQCSLYLPLILR